MSKSIYAIADCRVSDPSQLKGGSLDDQALAAEKFAEKKGWIVDRTFKKAHSAATTEREDFEEIKSYILKRRREGINITKYIVKKLDRFTRMGSKVYWKMKEELEAIGVELADCTGIIQPKVDSLSHLGDFDYGWNKFSPSEASETSEAYKGKADHRDILSQLIGAEITLTQRGYGARGAPDGLKNVHTFVSGKARFVRGADPDRAPFYQKMLELRADGMDDQEIVDRLNAMGFRTRRQNMWDKSDKENPRIVGEKGGGLLTVKKLQAFVMRTQYAGVLCEKWTKRRGVKMQDFEGIVPVDTFNKANRGKIYIDPVSWTNAKSGEEVIVKYNYSPWGRMRRHKDNPNYPWKCVLCPHCGLEMVGSAAKKKYDGYHCGGMKSGKRTHKYYRVPKEEFNKNVRAYLENLRFEEGFMAGLELHLIAEYRNREAEVLAVSSAVSRTVADLKAELSDTLNAIGRTKSPVVGGMLEEKAEKLDAEIKRVESERTRIEINEKNIRGFRRYAEHLMEHPYEILTEADSLHSRRALMSLFFEETPTYTDIVNGTPKLTKLFKLSETFKTNKSDLVPSAGIEPTSSP